MRRHAVDEVIMRFAGGQHGVVTRTQLLAAGVSAHQVDRRLQSSWLRPLHRGVYHVGPVTAPHTAEMAAVLACGDTAVLSHRSAAVLWELLAPARVAASIEVTIRRGHRARGPGIHVHRTRSLNVVEVTQVACIPVTTPVRTLLDLAAVVTQRDLERAVAEALARRLTASPRLLDALRERPPGRGAARLRALLEQDMDPAHTLSQAEDLFLDLIREAQLRRPEVNVVVLDYQVDFFWRVERLVVEIDGFAFHGRQRNFESDRRRDAVFAAAGIRVIRVTWRQMTTEPVAMLVRIAQALAQPGDRP